MEVTRFTHKFKPESAGRKLQNAINVLEEDIIAAEQASLTLDIGGYTVFMSASMELETEEDRSPMGAYMDETPDIMAKFDMNKILFKAINLQVLKWKAELLSKYNEYKKLTLNA